MNDIMSQIDRQAGEVRAESLDLSFGEIVNLHSQDELVIHPDYQKLFRWSDEQKSKLVESILLELPIPQIFVIENEDGVLELIDGLQRVSSVIQFIEPDKLRLEPLILQGCHIVKTLNDKKFRDLPLRLRLRLKRSSVRTIIIKRQSKTFLRYEMFKRLNTDGAILAPQEIRNCSARMIGDSGSDFYEFIRTCAKKGEFRTCIETLSQAEFEKKGDEELMLRFFALKNAQNLFKKSVSDWLDAYMEKVLLGELEFNYQEEEKAFNAIFHFFSTTLEARAFVKYRGGQAIGALAPAYFEAITMGVYRLFPGIQRVSKDLLESKIIETVQSDAFRNFTGPGANSITKLEGRINTIKTALEALLQ